MIGSSVAGTGVAVTVVVAVLACLEALDAVRTVSPVTLTGREIRLMLLAVAQITAAVFALKLRLLAAAGTHRVADSTGATSTAAWLGHLTQTDRPEATAQVRAAQDLEGRYPLLADALAAGRVSPEQVKVCLQALRRLPRNLAPDQLAACQRFLIDAAQRLTPRQLKTVGRKLWEVIDPDGAEAKDGRDLHNEEQLARAKAYFRSWRNGDGTTGFRGKLPDLHADILLKIITAHASPRRVHNPNIPTSQPDNHTHPHNTSPDSTSDTDPNPGEAADPQDTATGDSDLPDQGPPDSGPSGERPPGEPLGDANPPQDNPPDEGPPDEDESPEEPDTGRSVPYPVRLGHGLIDLIERLPKHAIPTTGGHTATVVVTLRYDQLLTGLGTATLNTGTTISATQALRLACQAGIIPAVLDGDGAPLHLGHERRLHNKHQRIAIELRDGPTCALHGCDIPAAWCHAHHVVPWSEGGQTTLDDGILICPHHHNLAHHPRWQLTRQDGVWRLRKVDSKKQTP